MNGFQRRREKKMKSILLAAFELFAARGVQDVTTEEIAKKAQVSQASIYNFFKSKKNLVREAMFAFMDDQMEASEKVLASELPFREKVANLLFITDEATRLSGAVFFQSAISSDPSIQELLEEYSQNRTDPFIMRLVEQGKAEGCINKSLSNDAIRIYIRGIREVLAQSDISKEARLDLNALFLYGLQGQP